MWSAWIAYAFVNNCDITDTKKMPLGKLSKTQIAKGFEVRCVNNVSHDITSLITGS